MSYLPLTLGVRRQSDAEKGKALNRAQAQAQHEKILKRDKYTCRYCGFQSEQYQRVVATPPQLKHKEDFVTTCTFCEQCLMLERAGMMGSGVLIWLPEISQPELNHLARAIYIARSSEGNAGNDMATLAGRAYDILLSRRIEAKKRLGSDDPLVLATVMHENLDDATYNAASTKLEGIRLMPLDKYVVRTKNGDINQFAQMIKYWQSAKGPYANMPVEQWSNMLQAAKDRIGHAENA